MAHVERPLAGIDTSRIEKLVRAGYVVADSHSAHGGGIAAILELEVKPHDELAGLFIVYNLRALQNTSLLDGASRPFGIYGKGYALVAPVVEVLRRIAMHSNICAVAALAFGLVLAEPVITAVVV